VDRQETIKEVTEQEETTEHKDDWSNRTKFQRYKKGFLLNYWQWADFKHK
jgi:hypothetical protein